MRRLQNGSTNAEPTSANLTLKAVVSAASGCSTPPRLDTVMKRLAEKLRGLFGSFRHLPRESQQNFGKANAV